ncbi:predicted protein [Sclerotinia sclerotiorum 1980 UF-70]|uniref:Uncharacterized protein n=1 Tax=Sclerotinia sclerotiorum (strain ATCC 18683 / 1980 / Ss-1) TaxID=665079 RepID=A7EVA0_SCLS1|nr:predicted protein [Sclerotinia sclerotiorum 1980 UF-70]EDN93392.1 predicted protein [Sclerotinia sclerotiorum 1980 UF-70]
MPTRTDKPGDVVIFLSCGTTQERYVYMKAGNILLKKLFTSNCQDLEFLFVVEKYLDRK